MRDAIFRPFLRFSSNQPAVFTPAADDPNWFFGPTTPARPASKTSFTPNTKF
jgi:hypothetical protein